jgi:hypothetical protein
VDQGVGDIVDADAEGVIAVVVGGRHLDHDDIAGDHAVLEEPG